MRPIWNSIVTFSGVKIQLPNIPCRQVDVRPTRTNSNLVYIGIDEDQSISIPDGEVIYSQSPATGGLDLAAGEPYSIPCTNANQVFVEGTSGESFRYVVYR